MGDGYVCSTVIRYGNLIAGHRYLTTKDLGSKLAPCECNLLRLNRIDLPQLYPQVQDTKTAWCALVHTKPDKHHFNCGRGYGTHRGIYPRIS